MFFQKCICGPPRLLGLNDVGIIIVIHFFPIFLKRHTVLSSYIDRFQFVSEGSLLYSRVLVRMSKKCCLNLNGNHTKRLNVFATVLLTICGSMDSVVNVLLVRIKYCLYVLPRLIQSNS